MVNFHITEPHPSAKSYLYSGRGGAGNVTRVKASELTDGRTASGPASRVKLTPPPTTGYFTSGRGGAGNMRAHKERAMFSFDEELAQQERLRSQQAPVYHIGRGGAGNLIDEMKPRSQRQNSASSTSSREREGWGPPQSGEVEQPSVPQGVQLLDVALHVLFTISYFGMSDPVEGWS